MPQLFLAFLFCCLSILSNAQIVTEKQLIRQTAIASTDLEKIAALNDLAEYYYVFKLDKKADSVLSAELNIAEISNNRDLVFQVLFSNVIASAGYWNSTESFERISGFLEKGLGYAKETNRSDYQAIAYIRLANLFRKRKEYDKAIENATLAFTALGNKKSDSLKSSLYLELGDVFMDKGDVVAAYRNYNNSFDLAYTIKNFTLQSEAYHRFAGLYQWMGDIGLAKESLLKSLELNTLHHDRDGLWKDYYDLAKTTDEKEFIIKAEELAVSLRSPLFILSSKRLMFAYLMVQEKNSTVSLDYLNENKDLKESYLNMGLWNYYWQIGNIYKYSDKPDSALYYYRLAEPYLKKTFEKSNLEPVYNDMAECYSAINKPDSAIHLYELAFSISNELNMLKANAAIAIDLSKLYAQINDFKKAFDYSQKYLTYQEELKKMVVQRDVTLLEMQRETLKHEKDMEEIARAQLKKRNLQYLSISIAIVGLFFFLLLMGAFPMSKFTIRILGYFSFICLFEFIVLLLDTYLHRITHGEPLKIWIIKIFLIAILVPFQHFLEHGLMKFVQSKKLMKLRNNLSVKKYWAKMKKPAHNTKTGLEEDTAVL
jgi:tetratricopeptide (TPR) repeat protein